MQLIATTRYSRHWQVTTYVSMAKPPQHACLLDEIVPSLIASQVNLLGCTRRAATQDAFEHSPAARLQQGEAVLTGNIVPFKYFRTIVLAHICMGSEYICSRPKAGKQR
jgi:hypothetical protein